MKVWFTDQSCEELKVKDKLNITLVINENVKYENGSLFSSTKDT